MPAAETAEQLKRLGRFVDGFSDCFGRRRRLKAATAYVTAILSDAERKSMAPMLERAPDPVSYEALQRFISEMPWDEEKVWEKLRRDCPDRRGVLILDDTGFPKQGGASVGVQRQYSGTLGRTGNCQIAVSGVLRSKRSTWPVAMDLYLPEGWTEDRVRRRRTQVPEDYEFRKKWEIALDQVRRAKADGLEIECVAADAGYGDATEFRDGIGAMGLHYAVGVMNALTVFAGPPRFRPPRRPKGPSRPETRWQLVRGETVSLKEIEAALPASAFRLLSWRKGTRGPLKARFCALRVTPARGWEKGERHPECWLLVERPLSGTGPKFYLSNLPPQTPLVRLVRCAHTRWAIEQSYQQMKEELGLDHFEGRTWTGFHHHAALTAVAFAFLQRERLRSRSGDLPTLPQVRKLMRILIGETLFYQRQPHLQPGRPPP